MQSYIDYKSADNLVPLQTQVTEIHAFAPNYYYEHTLS